MKASLSAANCCYTVLKAGTSKDLSKIDKSPSVRARWLGHSICKSAGCSHRRLSTNNGHATIRSGPRGMNHVFFYIPWMQALLRPYSLFRGNCLATVFTLSWKLSSLPGAVSLGRTIQAAAKPKRFREWVEKRNSEFQVLTWPPIPTDFNPSQNLWDVLDKSDPRRLQLATGSRKIICCCKLRCREYKYIEELLRG